jgi:branched-chain amino acid transport system substrate-binding protein
MQVRFRIFTTTTVLATAGVIGLAGCGSSSSGSGSGGLSGGGDNNSGAKTYDIGFEGPLSGANAQLGINEKYGAQLAIDQANANSSLGFKLKLVEADDQGNPAKAPAAATQLIQDPNMLGEIGPSFSGASLAVGKRYGAAGMAMITPSATSATLQTEGFQTWFRIVPNDNLEGSQAADWLARKGIKNLFVLQDLSAYGKGVGDTVAKEAKAKGIQVTEKGLDGTTTKNYKPIAQTIKASGADAMFYGGYDAQGALLAKALKSAGYTGLTVAGNGVKSSVFTDSAGSAADGWFLTCGCQDATVAPQSKDFADAYQAAFHTPSSTYSPEAYDATNLLIQAIKTASANGAPTLSSVVDAVRSSDYDGITGPIKFQSNGDLISNGQTVNLYDVENGKIVIVGNILDES